MRRSPALATIAAAGLALLAAGSREVEDPAPPGCHWQVVPGIKAQVAVPDGWEFRDTSTAGVLSYEIRPAGPGFEGSRSRFRLRVERSGDPASVVERARDYVERARGAASQAQPTEEQQLSVITLFSSVISYLPPVPGVDGLTSAVASAANARTGTLYMMRFDIPAPEVETIAPLGNHLFRVLRLDDEM